MPDGDVYHTGVALRFQKPYKMLCEGRSTREATERILLRAVKKEIQRCGDALVQHAQQVADAVDQALREAGDVTSGCVLGSKAVDRIGYSPGLPPRLADFVSNAAKDYLHDVRYGRLEEIRAPREEILQRVFHRFYRSEFEEPIASNQAHHAGADPGDVEARLQEVRPAVDYAFSQWARKADHEASLAGLRVPPRARMAAVDLDENIL